MTVTTKAFCKVFEHSNCQCSKSDTNNKKKAPH